MVLSPASPAMTSLRLSCLLCPRAVPTAAQEVTGFGTRRTQGLIFTVLLSLNNGQAFSPAPFQIFPRDYVQLSFSNPASFLNDFTVYGITWENSARGWIYGKGYILVRASIGRHSSFH